MRECPLQGLETLVYRRRGGKAAGPAQQRVEEILLTVNRASPAMASGDGTL